MWDDMNMAVQRKCNEWETQSQWIVAYNKAFRIKYVKSRIDKIQENSVCNLSRERDYTVKYKSECNKIAKKEIIQSWTKDYNWFYFTKRKKMSLKDFIILTDKKEKIRVGQNIWIFPESRKHGSRKWQWYQS